MLESKTEKENSIIKRLAINKAPQHDEITNKTQKKLTSNIIRRITSIFHGCLNLNHFPSSWKKATVITLPKPGKDLTNPSKYRSISLLPSISRIFEKIIQKRLEAELRKTNKQALRIMEKAADCFPRKKSAGILYLDIEKAFDKV